MVNRGELLKVCAKLHGAVLAKNRTQISTLVEKLPEMIGWKVSRFCKRLDISDQTYNRWVRKVGIPRLSFMERLERVLREEDLEAQILPYLGLSDLGFHTWKQMAEKALDPRLTRMWVISAERFLEEQRVAVAEHMWKALRYSNFEACYVFPKDSSGAASWHRWASVIKDDERQEGNGRTLGFEIVDINRRPMFTHSVYEVLYEYGDRLEGFLAFPPPDKIYNIVQPEEEYPRFPRLVWMSVDDNTTGLWFSTYCRPLAKIAEKQTVASDKLAVHVRV